MALFCSRSCINVLYISPVHLTCTSHHRPEPLQCYSDNAIGSQPPYLHHPHTYLPTISHNYFTGFRVESPPSSTSPRGGNFRFLHQSHVQQLPTPDRSSSELKFTSTEQNYVTTSMLPTPDTTSQLLLTDEPMVLSENR